MKPIDTGKLGDLHRQAHSSGMPAEYLLKAVTLELDNEYGPLWRQGHPKLPEGLRLELGGAAYNRLLRDPATFNWSTGPDGLARQFGVPVKIVHELEYAFRLVIVTEKVLLGGAL
jgi:hypothetical protein